MREGAVLRVGPVDPDARLERARREVALGLDVVAGERRDGRAGGAVAPRLAEDSVLHLARRKHLLDDGAAYRRAGGDVVEDEVRDGPKERGEYRLAPLLLGSRPGDGGRPLAEHGEGDHVERGRLASASLAGRDEERRPLAEEVALDDAERQREEHALALVVRRYVDEPLVGEEVDGLGDLRAANGAAGHERDDLGLDAEDYPPRPVEAVRRQEPPVGQDDGHRRERRDARQARPLVVQVVRHEAGRKPSRNLERRRPVLALDPLVEADVALDREREAVLVVRGERSELGRRQAVGLLLVVVGPGGGKLVHARRLGGADLDGPAPRAAHRRLAFLGEQVLVQELHDRHEFAVRVGELDSAGGRRRPLRRREIPRVSACPSWSPRCLQAARDSAARFAGGEARAAAREREHLGGPAFVDETVTGQFGKAAGGPENDAVALTLDRALDAPDDRAQSRVERSALRGGAWHRLGDALACIRRPNPLRNGLQQASRAA